MDHLIQNPLTEADETKLRKAWDVCNETENLIEACQQAGMDMTSEKETIINQRMIINSLLSTFFGFTLQ